MKHATYQSATYLECYSAIEAATLNPDVDPFVKTMFELGMIPPEAAEGADQIESLEWTETLPISRSFVADMIATVFETDHGLPIKRQVDDHNMSLEFVSSTRSKLRFFAGRDGESGVVKMQLDLRPNRPN